MFRGTVIFAANKLSAKLEGHFRNCVHRKKFKNKFNSPNVPKPVIMHLFGQYDKTTRRGYELKLHFQSNGNKFNSQAESPTDSAALWLTDQILSTPEHIIVWELPIGKPEENPVYYRYSFTNYKWSLPSANLVLTHEFQTKNGKDSEWIPMV